MPGVRSPALASASIAHRNAARVFPDPVGATTSELRREEIVAQASSWTAVGRGKTLENHCLVGAENGASGSFMGQ